PDQGSLGIFGLLVPDFGFQYRHALRRHEPLEKRIVDPRRRVAVGKQEFIAYQSRDDGDVALLEQRDEVRIHLPVADVVGKDIQASVNEHLCVHELVGMAERELAWLVRLLENGGASLW